MKYTNSISHRRNRKRRRNAIKLIAKVFAIVIFVVAFSSGLFYLLNQSVVTKYETKHYTTALHKESLFAEELCVATANVEYPAFQTEDSFYATGLFNLTDETVLMSENIHERIYPASTTKLLTFYIAVKYGDLEEMVTVSNTSTILPSGSSRAWLKEGDQMTLRDLLYSMMIASGNDSAIAVAEYVSGSEEAFAELMNKEAKLLGASNSNFVNAHGYHDDNHYTTAYDLYLIMNACLKNETFIELISTDTYRTAITEPNGYQRKVEWIQSNYYLNGIYESPEGVTVIGGKTGTTDEAKACLILYSKDSEGDAYLSIIMGADNKTILYNNMSALLSTISNAQ